MATISIPFNFKPRSYQLELLTAMDSGFKRAITVWHRRAGKDKTLFNMTIKKALERVGTYYYFFPEFAQGRRVIWEGMDRTGFRFLHHIPQELLAKPPNSTDMKIELVNGSFIHIIGTDKFDKVRGANPVGCVFSEFAYQNPLAWDIVRPILNENKGWAVFNSTPFGKNHFYDLYTMGKNNPNWFTQFITVEDSLDENGNRFITEESIQEEIDSGMSEELAQQEFYCSFSANSQGFYYLTLMEKALNEDRIVRVTHDPSLPVDTWWDIGVGDSTAIWFTQIVNKTIHVIDFFQDNSHGVDYYAKQLSLKPYTYGTHHFPHDMRNTEFGTGRSRLEVAEELFPNNYLDIVQKVSIEDGINAARMILPYCYFDKDKCEKGIRALQNYHREWDDARKEYKNKPVHDWSSHPADAFRYMGVGLQIPKETPMKAVKFKNYKSKARSNRKAKGWMVA